MRVARYAGMLAISGALLACGIVTPPPAIAPASEQPKPAAIVCPPAPEPPEPDEPPRKREKAPDRYPLPSHCIATPTEKHKTIEAALQGTWCNSEGSVGLRFEGDQHWSDDGRMLGVDVQVERFEVLPVSKSSIRHPRSPDHHVLRTHWDHDREITDPRAGAGESVQFFHSDFSSIYYRSASSSCLCFQDAWLVHLARWEPDYFDRWLEFFDRVPVKDQPRE